jgi:hypothetical protein
VTFFEPPWRYDEGIPAYVDMQPLGGTPYSLMSLTQAEAMI